MQKLKNGSATRNNEEFFVCHFYQFVVYSEKLNYFGVGSRMAGNKRIMIRSAFIPLAYEVFFFPDSA